MENTGEIIVPSFQHYFRVDILVLQLMGLSSYNTIFSNGEYHSSWTDGCYFIIGVSSILSIVSCQFCTIFIIGVELNYSIEIFASMCTTLLCGIKGMRWWTQRQQLYNILRQISIQWENARARNILTMESLKAAESSKSMRNIYMIAVFIVFSSYAIRPYILYLNHTLHRDTNETFDYLRSSVYPAFYPIIIESPQKFCAIVTYQTLTGVFVCIYWVSSETLYAQLLTHISIQFFVLAGRLENIIADNNSKYDDDIRHELQKIAKQHHELFICCRANEVLYTPVLFLTVLSNGTILCACLYLMEDQLATLDLSEASKSVSHLITLAIQTVIYCGYADSLTRSSERVCHAAYSSQWPEWSKRNKMILQLIMMRAAKEYKYTAYGMISLSLKQVTAIANGAVSYFMLLRGFG